MSTSYADAATEPVVSRDDRLTEPVQCCSRGFASRIESWLLHSDIQIPTGELAGGIAGWLDAEGRPEYVYPEIAGYYMTSMAWFASGAASSPRHVGLARMRAQRTAEWIAKLMSSASAPPTRLYLNRQVDDWRNDAVFSFDIAMAARGMAGVSCGARRLTLARLCLWLNRISMNAPIMQSHDVLTIDALPTRWSTLPGPHHLKAAAAVLGVAESPPSLRALMTRTTAHWARVLASGDWPCQELHALCYGIEGMLIAGTDNADGLLDQASLAFTHLMELQAPNGTLTERVDGGIVRSDVLAQALRIGLILRGSGYLMEREWADRLDAMAAALMGYVRPDGGVLFARDQSIANTWCAMFAQQALYLHARRHSADPVPLAATEYLV